MMHGFSLFIHLLDIVENIQNKRTCNSWDGFLGVRKSLSETIESEPSVIVGNPRRELPSVGPLGGLLTPLMAGTITPSSIWSSSSSWCSGSGAWRIVSDGWGLLTVAIGAVTPDGSEGRARPLREGVGLALGFEAIDAGSGNGLDTVPRDTVAMALRTVPTDYQTQPWTDHLQSHISSETGPYFGLSLSAFSGYRARTLMRREEHLQEVWRLPLLSTYRAAQ
jgi:hypothetical protein